MHLQKILVRIAGLAALSALAAQAALVSPNPKSNLAKAKVLVVRASNWTGADPGHANAIKNALAKLEAIRVTMGMSTDAFKVVDNVESYTLAALTPYDVIVFNYVFNSQKAVGTPFEGAFKSWLALGNKGWVGYHTSGANDVNEWNWYRDSITSMRYHVHSVAAQQGKMNKTTDPTIRNLPILEGLDETFTGTDEWYDFDLPPRAPQAPTWDSAKVLYTLDEATLVNKPTRPMNPHPMAWIRGDARGNRFFYSGFIHSEQGANSDFFHNVLLRALEYAAGKGPDPIVTMDGQGIVRVNKVTFTTGSRDIRVNLNEAYTLSVFSATGAKLQSFQGKGVATYTPDAFAQPGIYMVKVNSKSEKIAQKVMICR